MQPDVDDTDGLDPATEFEEWRARELARLLRDKEAQAAKDAEREEIERRRALPEEQRLREDMEHAEATRAKEKGDMGFMQKYYHKGAFHLVSLAIRIYEPSLTLRTRILQIEIIPWQRRVLWTCLCCQRCCKCETTARCRAASTPISQTRIHHKADGEPPRDKARAHLVNKAKLNRAVGTVEDRICGKIAQTTTSTPHQAVWEV